MITLTLGYVYGDGTKLSEVFKSASSLQLQATTVQELVERIHELYPNTRSMFDYNRMSEGPYTPWLIRVNGKTLSSYEAIREVRFAHGDVVHITSIMCDVFMEVIETGLRGRQEKKRRYE